MSLTKHRLTALVALAICAAVAWLSFAPSEPEGYEFPRMIAVALLAVGGTLVVLAFRPGGQAEDAEDSVPWGAIWPALLVMLGFLVVSRTLGYFATSFLAFYALAVIYTPEPFSLRLMLRCGTIAAAFIAVLYLVFVTILNVRVPGGALF